MAQVSRRFDPLGRLRGVFYGWWLVGLASLISVIVVVPLFQAIGIWMVVLERYFGWSRTQLSLVFLFTRLEAGLLGPVEGYLTDRLGTRRMVLIGLSVLGGGWFLFSNIQNLWMFYLAFMVMTLGQGLGGGIPLMTAINNWFVRRRATAMGWAELGNPIGGLALVPVIAWAVDPDIHPSGWRVAATTIAGVSIIAAIAIPRFIRNRPEDYGQRPDGDVEIPPPVPPLESAVGARRGLRDQEADFTARQALRTSAFWYISLGHAFLNVLMISIMAHLPLMLSDEGLSLRTTGWIVMTYTGTSTVFQVLGGYIGDRVPKNLAIFVFASFTAGSIMAITLADGLPMTFLFAAVFGVGVGGRAPLTIAMRGDYFGRKAFASILGISMVPMNVLLVAGPLLTGVYRDHWGSYTLPFNVLAGLCFLGGVLFLLARKPTLPPNPSGP